MAAGGGYATNESVRTRWQRSPHLQAQARQAKSLDSTDPTEPAAETIAGTAWSSSPRADQFCVYNTSSVTRNTEHRIAAFIIEYKALHKLFMVQEWGDVFRKAAWYAWAKGTYSEAERMSLKPTEALLKMHGKENTKTLSCMGILWIVYRS